VCYFSSISSIDFARLFVAFKIVTINYMLATKFGYIKIDIPN